jgi:RNA polymerase II subunit A small phosphatase-like protein
MTTTYCNRSYISNHNNRDVSDLKLQLGDKKQYYLGDNVNSSPLSSLVTQVSKTQIRVASPTIANSYTPSTPSTAYLTPVAGSEPSNLISQQIDTSKKITYYKQDKDNDTLDLNGIQFSVAPPQTSSPSKTPVTPKVQQPSPNGPKRNKLLNYLLKSISWCFSTSNQPPNPSVKNYEDEQVEEEEVEETTVTTKTIVRRTSKKEEESDEQVEVQEEQSWSSKRLTTKKKKNVSTRTPTTPSTTSTCNNVASPTNNVRTTFKTNQKFLLGEQSERVKGKKCLVLDLDETLVHSCFQPIANPDFVLPIEIEGTRHMVYVLKRPFVDDFLLEMSKVFEIVVFTASLSKYANPLLDQLDKHNVISARLFREHCTFIDNCYIKDLSRLGRELSQTLIIDNSPTCYALQPQNAMAVSTWFDDKKDTQLQQMIPWLLKMGDQKDVYETLNEYRLYYSQNGWSGSQHW